MIDVHGRTRLPGLKLNGPDPTESTDAFKPEFRISAVLPRVVDSVLIDLREGASGGCRGREWEGIL